jgi:hypothetical protein
VIKLLTLALLAGAAFGTPNFAFVQQATSVSSGTPGARSAAFGSNNTPGNVIIVLAYTGSTTISDSAGNSYAEVPWSVGPGMRVYAATHILGGANTVAAVSEEAIVAIEYSSVSSTYCVFDGSEQTGGTNVINNGVYVTASEAMAVFSAQNCCGGAGSSLAAGSIRGVASAGGMGYFWGDYDMASVPSTYTNIDSFTPTASGSRVVFISQTGTGCVGPASGSFAILY